MLLALAAVVTTRTIVAVAAPTGASIICHRVYWYLGRSSVARSRVLLLVSEVVWSWLL